MTPDHRRKADRGDDGTAEDKLSTYRRKRSAERTPEPMGGQPKKAAPKKAGAPKAVQKKAAPRRKKPRFVIQEHHARALHWDFRLERHGVLVSWAVPKGLPLDRKTNHLAVHVEDHPLEYASFRGRIPEGEYGAGDVFLWDKGTYDEEKWSDREVMVVLHGKRAKGRYVLFQTGGRDGKDWMIHRMDDAPAGYEPLPTSIAPMLAVSGSLPKSDDGWSYEFKWDGIRAVAYVDGGRIRLCSRNGNDLTSSFPELRALGEALGSRQVVLDGEIVAFDDEGRPSFQRLQPRIHASNETQARRRAEQQPVSYLLFDVMHAEGRSLLDEPYTARRDRLEQMKLDGPHWSVSPRFPGPGHDILEASKEQGLEGVVAKRDDSTYLPGRRSPAWTKVKNLRTQEVVVGGFTPGEGRRAGRLGSLILGIPGEGGALEYVGQVGTGFDEAALTELGKLLSSRERRTSPFAGKIAQPYERAATWVEPELVGEVSFSEWTKDGRLRQPSWRGLRDDKSPSEVVRES